MTAIAPIDQANLLAGHAVAYATAFLDGRHDAARLAENAERLFLELLVVETEETGRFLIPVQLLAITMMRTAKHARESNAARDALSMAVEGDRVERWRKIMAALVELVFHESNELRRSGEQR